MAIGTGPMELEIWQMLLMAIGAGAILLLAVVIIRDHLLRRGTGLDASDAKRFETRRKGARLGSSFGVAVVVMGLAVERSLIEAAVPWHELLMILGVGAVVFAAAELVWALSGKAISCIRAMRPKGPATN
ncbi:MAG: hypothetical protein KGZ66_10845 [Selenomonadales bacterium]|nr:hypothetical protein [Selenomonadales bacterium]